MSGAGIAFNLLYERWIPVRRLSGAGAWIAPWEIAGFGEDDPPVALAWPRADFNGACHEFLIGLLATAAAPPDEAAWRHWWQTPPEAGELRALLEPHAGAFSLDGPGPRFLQDLDELAKAEEKDVTQLLIEAPGAQTLRNNTDLFVKRARGMCFGRAAAAMALYALQTFAPSGGAGHRTSLRGGGPLTTLVVGGTTLWHRLWPNVETREQIADRRADGGRGDLPVFPWLAPTRTSDPKAHGRDTTPADVHPLQVYWGMPRRIRLEFEPAEGRRCEMTGMADTVVVRTYRTLNYGTNYGEGFVHPLTPHYRQKEDTALLPVHAQPGGVSYRHWLGLVLADQGGLRQPAAAVLRVLERRRIPQGARLVAFGYDMDNMKARAWVESEMPLLIGDQTKAEHLEFTAARLVLGAQAVAGSLTGAVKAALLDNPKDAPGDWGFVGERFWRETQAAFFAMLESARRRVAAVPEDEEDPTTPIRQDWARQLERPALGLFDELAPSEGLEHRAMARYVRARHGLFVMLRGYGKSGAGFCKVLDIPPPATGGKKNARKAEDTA